MEHIEPVDEPNPDLDLSGLGLAGTAHPEAPDVTGLGDLTTGDAADQQDAVHHAHSMYHQHSAGSPFTDLSGGGGEPAHLEAGLKAPEYSDIPPVNTQRDTDNDVHVDAVRDHRMHGDATARRASSMTTEELVDLQNEVQKGSEDASLLTNIASMKHQTNMGIIGNIR